MRDDTPSLYSQLHAAVARGELQGPWKAIGNLQAYGSAGTPMVCEAVGEGMSPGAIDNLVNDLTQQITDKVGLDPRGKLRVKVYEKGSSGTPQVDHTRRIEVKLFEGDEESVAQLRAQLAEERNHSFRLMQAMFELQRLLVEQAGQSNTLAATAVQATMQIGTVRGQVAAASDAGQLNSAVGVLVLMLGLPLLREAFDLPESMPLSQIVRLATERLKRALLGAPGPEGGNVSTPARIPAIEDAGDPVSESTEDGETEEDETHTSEQAPPAPSVVLEWARTDPGWGANVYKAIMADSALVAKIMEAA